MVLQPSRPANPELAAFHAMISAATSGSLLKEDFELMDIRQLQKSADHHRRKAETVEDPQLAQTHLSAAEDLDEIIAVKLADKMQLDRIRQR